jgi:hypothetical protein
MPGEFDYKPKFFDIRVRPPKEGEKTKAETDVYTLKPGEKPCDWPECRKAGAAKAPKSREMLNEHYWFCQGHAAEYNKNWDFFAGMTDAEQRAIYESRATGDRPTWSFKASRTSREAAAFAAKMGTGKGYQDGFGLFGERVGGASAIADAGPAERQLGKLEGRALAELNLGPNADAGTIRLRYLDLVKRCHPDSNGGDRSTEDKLQRVLKAYKTLRAAKLV